MERHKCASNRLCVNKIHNQATGKHEAATIDKPQGFCDGCTRQIRNAYRDAVTNYHLLSKVIGDKQVTSGVKVASTPEAPMPLNATVLALQATLSDVCAASVVLVAPALGITAKPRHAHHGFPIREIVPIAQAHNVIPDNLGRLIEAEPVDWDTWDATGTQLIVRPVDGITTALAMLRTTKKIHGVVGDTDGRTRLAMPCPVIDCGKRTLGIDNGQTDVTCSACGGRWTDREYKWLSGLLIEDHNQKEHTVLTWLLAEANWKLSQAESKLDSVRKVANLTDDELSKIESWAIATVLKEIVG